MEKSSSGTKVWRLRAKLDKRFRSGHPWVYSNELQESPKGIEPGEPIELRDAGGEFLARGYGNATSLIAFRTLSRDREIAQPHAPEEVLKTLESAVRLRTVLGLSDVSYRLCFGEADGLPGLVIDRFKVGDDAQVFAIQIHTAGMSRIEGALPEILQTLTKKNGDDWNRTGLVLRNDLSIRKLEGIAEEEPKVLREISGVDLSQARIRVRAAQGTGHIEMETDLIRGQKTGFFLDQAANVQLAARMLQNLKPAQGKTIRILDICCYVGQWSAQLTRVFRAQGFDVHVTAVDASAQALERARGNIEAQGAAVETIKMDVLKGLADLKERSFDLVICDPPALIQGRKDIPTGTHAYLQVNTQVFRLVRREGAVISCSCSALLEEEDFVRTLSKAAYRNRVKTRWVARGGQAPDHPILAEFPEGRYLKAWIGLTS